MNEQQSEGPGVEPGGPQERADGTGVPEAPAPFRRLRSGRRRAAPTAPWDEHAPGEEPAHPAAAQHAAAPADPDPTEPEPVDTEPTAPAAMTADTGDGGTPDPVTEDGGPVEDPAPEDLPVRDHHQAELLQAHPPVDSDDVGTEHTPGPLAAQAPSEAPAAEDLLLADPEPEAEEESPTESLLNGSQSTPGVRKRRRKRRNVIMAIVIGIFAIILAVTVLLLQNILGMWTTEDYPGPGEGEVTFTVEPGWGPSVIGGHLTEKDIVSDRKIFLEAVQDSDAENKEIHPGEYQLKYKMAAQDAADILIGEAADKVSYVAVKQNVRTKAVFEKISEDTGVSLGDLEDLNDQPEKFGLKKPVKNLEGYLHPGEYRFPLDATAEDMLQEMVDATTKELTSQGVTDPAKQYRALKIASILQAEASPKDYKIVSGALDNRLKPDNKETDGLLQVDSSVIYGLDRYTLQLSKEEKADKSNKYNSYQHRGLPPTPIGSPGDKAIDAAIHPEKNDYYYWVTVNTETGETKFAKTYEQHKVYQQEFRDWCSDNEDICK
ncbi:MAG: endolytic transglycosylase MltG [Micrococcaceae bacterium]|nr:endolytic transglycosylase MltG [Micrococcaceae bacterium]MDN5887388.1 endolytic transglycosylase MltG [Micrococcaceae bacterium]